MKTYREEQKDKISEQMKAYRGKNRDDILKQWKTYRYENKEKITEYYHPKDYLLASMNFYKEVQWRPSFCCCSCCSAMFKHGVKTVTKEFVQKLEENGLIYLTDLSPRMQHSTGNFYNCDNCHLYLQRNELPPLTVACRKIGLFGSL